MTHFTCCFLSVFLVNSYISFSTQLKSPFLWEAFSDIPHPLPPPGVHFSFPLPGSSILPFIYLTSIY